MTTQSTVPTIDLRVGSMASRLPSLSDDLHIDLH